MSYTVKAINIPAKFGIVSPSGAVVAGVDNETEAERIVKELNTIQEISTVRADALEAWTDRAQDLEKKLHKALDKLKDAETALHNAQFQGTQGGR